VLPSIFGETVVLRILDKSALGLDIQKLGLAGDDLLLFKRNVKKPYGMILIAGPTGSGKTTTLYSALKFVHTPKDKFITIEDPGQRKKGSHFQFGVAVDCPPGPRQDSRR